MKFNFSMIVADTSRSRVYLNALQNAKMLPSRVFFMQNNNNISNIGALEKNFNENQKIDHDWPEALYNPKITFLEIFKNLKIPYRIFNTTNINDPALVNEIKNSENELVLYSGYGGGILREDILNSNKKFLHIHGGYLPKYKGSTTNYYSILDENIMGATAIILNSRIDCGPIIYRQKYKPTKDKKNLDHLYDSAVRARVLIKAINILTQKGLSFFEDTNNNENPYYIIHPVLKHIAILK